MRRLNQMMMAAMVVAWTASAVSADEFSLVTGVAPGTSPGAPRLVLPQMGFPGQFDDGQRLGGTPSAVPTSYLGTGAPLFSANQYGSLSYLFRRGSIPAGPSGNVPALAVDYLGGPLLDLDGDLNNGSRSLIPVAGQSPVSIPGSQSFLDLTVNKQANTVTLNNFEATSNNVGFDGFGPEIAAGVNTIAGTQPNATFGAPINPAIDTRSGALTDVGLGLSVYAINNLGFEIWQDVALSDAPGSPTAQNLGTIQYLGALNGFLFEADAQGDFGPYAGTGIGSTAWPSVAPAGAMFNQSSGGVVTATDGVTNDPFSAAGNGGLSLTDFGGDLGAYLDQVVVPSLATGAQRFVYLESAGFGANNSFDPVFQDTNGYDVVLIAQFIPEPAAGLLLVVGAALVGARRRRF